jgi:cytidyltransferase-like protein
MKIVIVSGYFNPIHIGHIKLFREAKKLGDFLIVIVNNDIQQMIKKGKIIMNQHDRLEVVKSISYVDSACLAMDSDNTVCQTLVSIINKSIYVGNEFIFANGGDRDESKKVPEADICERAGIKMIFDCGGTDKADSSTRINNLIESDRNIP